MHFKLFAIFEYWLAIQKYFGIKFIYKRLDLHIWATIPDKLITFNFLGFSAVYDAKWKNEKCVYAILSQLITSNRHYAE